MPFQPRSYPLVNMPEPQPINVVGTLADLTQLESAREVLKQNRQRSTEAERQQASQRVIETALNEARGDVPKAIGSLEGAGRWGEANLLKGKQDQIEQAQRQQTHEAVTAMGQRLGGLKTTAAKGAELLREIETDPARYPQVLPTLRDLAGSLDPRLAQEIPEQYDPARVRSMVQFAADLEGVTDVRVKATELLKTRLAEKKAAKEAFDLDRQIAGGWFSVSPDQDDWDSSMEYAGQLGIAPEILARIGPTWSPAAVDRARALALEPREPEKPPAPDRTLVQTMGPDGKPVWTPRAQAVGKLVPVTAPRPATVNVGSAERWKQGQIAALDTERGERGRGRPNSMTEAEYADRLAKIETSYQRQVGGGAQAPPPALGVERHPPGWTPDKAVVTMADLAPDVLAKVKDLLRANGLADDEENINAFLAVPQNRQALGLTKR